MGMLVKCQQLLGESGDNTYPSVIKLNTMALLFQVRICKIQYKKELTIKFVGQ